MNHSDNCVPECTEDTSHLIDNGRWETPQPRCRECKQSTGHKVNCSIGRAHHYTPAPGEWRCACCGHPLTLRGEPNTSYTWECSEDCRCLILGCVPDYD